MKKLFKKVNAYNECLKDSVLWAVHNGARSVDLLHWAMDDFLKFGRPSTELASRLGTNLIWVQVDPDHVELLPTGFEPVGKKVKKGVFVDYGVNDELNIFSPELIEEDAHQGYWWVNIVKMEGGKIIDQVPILSLINDPCIWDQWGYEPTQKEEPEMALI